MTRPRSLLAAAVVLPLVLAGCTSEAGGSNAEGMFASNVKVDTPKLRAAKEAAGIEPCVAGSGDTVSDGLPEVTLPCLGGGPDVNLASLRGPMVVNLWASWCGPCRDELPYYQQLHAAAKDKVTVLGIDYEDTNPDAALELADKVGVTYPLLADPSSELEAPLRILGLPGVVFVDADGKVTHREYVVIESYEQLSDLVEEHLDVGL